MPCQLSTNKGAEFENAKNKITAIGARDIAEILVQKKYEKPSTPKHKSNKENEIKVEEERDFYMKRSQIEGCECEDEAIASNKKRYKELVELEKSLRKRVDEVDQEMSEIVEKIRDSCRTDDGGNRTSYTADYCSGQIQPQGEPWKEGYKKRSVGAGKAFKDELHFRYSKKERPRAQPESPIDFSIIPPADPIWHQRFGGDSEYTATISAMGLKYMHNKQVYLIPRFSRKRPPESRKKRKPSIIV